MTTRELTVTLNPGVVDALKPDTSYRSVIGRALAKRLGFRPEAERYNSADRYPVNRAARRAVDKAKGRLDGPNSDRVRTSPRALRVVPCDKAGRVDLTRKAAA